MALFRSIGARKDATRGTAAIEVRKGLAWLFSGPGVLPGADSPLVTGTSGWAYSVGKAGFVSTRGASDGVHLFGNDGAVTIGATGVGSTVPVAPGSGLQRIDIIWVIHPSASENSDTTSQPVFGVTSGAAASSAQPPTIPTGALELARNLMTSSATSTASSGNSITQSAPRSFIGTSPWAAYNAAPAGFAVGTGGLAHSTTEWRREGDLVHARCLWVLGTTGFTAPNNPRFSLPLGAQWTGAGAPVTYRITGSASIVSGATGVVYPAHPVLTSSGVVQIMYDSPVVGITPTAPWTWGPGDSIFVDVTYRPV
ncbi:hypothetical protein QUV83_08260 [Cellulomonas cellasea]|uniref:hypothetical protein n=1 Tax=Cellulomonas cellasea TaxID=43670 RepID=UPI0025A3E14B|nr:hypothetical protein [Cellulomonas cellasea]MDM8084753.1 hypothetical protein [Cellulomonas cellasea]